MIERLPAPTQTVYAELLERSIQLEAADVLGVAGSGSFVEKEIKGRRYWYLQKSEGRAKRQLYLGPDSPALRSWMTKVREEREATRSQVEAVVRLSAMLTSGGAPAEPAAIIKVLEILRDAEVFRRGGVLIGTVAYRGLGTALGVRLEASTLRTEDVDIAHEPDLAVGLTPDGGRGSVADRLLGADEGFQPIPTLDPRQPSTSFSVRSLDLRVDFLVPARGRNPEGPVFLPELGLSATPVRFLEYLIEAPIRAVLAGPRPVLVNVPQPARFAFHKIYTAVRRSAAFQTKAFKDIAQATSLAEVLIADRPDDLTAAWRALAPYPKVSRRIERAFDRLPSAVAGALQRLTAESGGP